MRGLLVITPLLFLCDLRGLCGDPVRLTTDGSFKQNLHFAPDGKTVLFTRIHQGKMALWTMSADGTDLKRLLPGHDTPHFDGHFSPDGRRVASPVSSRTASSHSRTSAASKGRGSIRHNSRHSTVT